MAQKTIILYVCDRCHQEKKRPLPGQIKIQVSAKKWNTWELCGNCNEELGDFLMAGHPDVTGKHDTELIEAGE
jgi:hypothetical protein